MLGKNATMEFDAANHSQEAKDIMNDFIIGKFDRVSKDDTSKQFKATVTSIANYKSKLEMSIILDKNIVLCGGEHIAIIASINNEQIIRKYTPTNLINESSSEGNQLNLAIKV